jgi:hypothetical protein
VPMRPVTPFMMTPSVCCFIVKGFIAQRETLGVLEVGALMSERNASWSPAHRAVGEDLDLVEARESRHASTHPRICLMGMHPSPMSPRSFRRSDVGVLQSQMWNAKSEPSRPQEAISCSRLSSHHTW